MTVKELMELLVNHDPNAEVVLAEQPSYPVEHNLAGVTTREACWRAYDEDRDERDWVPTRTEADGAPTDVILIEGTWSRYGHRVAWEVGRRERG